MFGLWLLVRLLLAPVLVVMLNLAVLPLFLLGGVGLFLVFSPVGAGASPTPGVLFFTSLFVLFVMICITTQMARYAGSFSGALPLSQQIRFFRAFWRTVLILILFMLVSIVIGVAIAMLAIRSGLDLALLVDPGGSSDQTEQLQEQALAGLLESKFILAYAMLVLLMSSVQAVFLVPAACGMGERFAWAWTGPYLLLRFVVVVPFLAAVLFFLSDGIASLILSGLSAQDEVDPSRAAIRQALMMVFAMSFAMAGEVAILASARVSERAAQPVEDTREHHDPEVRQLLQTWMADGR